MTSDQQTETTSTATASAGKTKRHARTVYVDDGLWERVRAAVGHMRYFDIPDEPDTLVDLVQSALEVRVAELEAKYGPFRALKAELKPGPGSRGRARLSEPRKP